MSIRVDDRGAGRGSPAPQMPGTEDSGVYFVNMSSDDRNDCHKEVQKIVLLK